MTDNDIIKALECCTSPDCENCPYDGDDLLRPCSDNLMKDAFDLINRQKAEIESLKNDLAKEFTCFVGSPHKVDHCPFFDELEKERAEAVKEFAERLKTEAKLRNHTNYGANKQAVSYNEGVIETRKFMLVCIDNLVEELVGEG